MPLPDHRLFAENEISKETLEFNAEITAKLNALPDQWSFTPAESRERRAQGLGAFPPPPLNPNAESWVIDGPHGPIPLRVIKPENKKTHGVYMHIHGGGWTFGSAHFQDPRLQNLANHTGLTAISVDYKLAPEHPYPQAPDECEAAALWILQEGAEKLGGVANFAIGGESAGAHLTATTLLRLREKPGLRSFNAAVFTSGAFDLRLTPSARNWGEEKLILNTRDLTIFINNYLGENQDPSNPDISPLLADLTGLPPAHFVVGTRDPLLDDTLFMSARWRAAGNVTEAEIYPGGCHVFQSFPLKITELSDASVYRFLGDNCPH